MNKQYVTVSVGLAAGLVATLPTVIDLHAQQVPGRLLLTCALASFVSAGLAVLYLVEAAHTRSVTHRCPVSDCDFSVRPDRADAASSRHWQEVAAAHPDHRLPAHL